MAHPGPPQPSSGEPYGAPGPAGGPGQPPYGPPPGGYPPPYGPPPGGYPPVYGAPPGGYPYAPQRTNGMAVASMVLGILWIYWIGSILALVFGYVAKRQIKERGESGSGMATAGIVLGWVGVGILVLLLVFGVAASTSP